MDSMFSGCTSLASLNIKGWLDGTAQVNWSSGDKSRTIAVPAT